ncbi:MAG: hypothetical protein NT062_29515 [Proteobacteria bacterium]|nr:hypothetical protein [Pseudomonadota bacterium]
MSKDLFASTKTKLTIASLDEGVEVKAQYNPKELQVDRSIPWAKPPATNKTSNTSQPGEIRLEFTGAEGRSMQVELLFDGYENGGQGVAQSISDLEKLASVRDAASTDEAKRRPHRCVVRWGDRGLPTFRCVIESLSVKYQMFSEDGLPLRATATVKLKEADVVNLAKKS